MKIQLITLIEATQTIAFGTRGHVSTLYPYVAVYATTYLADSNKSNIDV